MAVQGNTTMEVRNQSRNTPANQLGSCHDIESVSHIAMIVVVMLGSIVGNSIVCLLLIRFKTLRTVPNILVANLAAIDIVNALTNMPLLIMWYICKVPFFKGRDIAWFTISWYVLFMYLTVFSLIVLTMDRFGAIVHGFRYHSWKTRNKAFVAVMLVWLLAAIYTYGMFSLGLGIDVGDAPVFVYRVYYFKEFGRKFIIPGYLVPFTLMLIMGAAIWYTVHAHSKRISPHSSAAKRAARNDVQTAKTIGLTIMAYFFMGFFPMLLHNIARIHGTWLHFLAFFFVHLNSMANPIIYSLKARRFRQAFKLFLKDPCGKSQPYMVSRSQMELTGVTKNLTNRIADEKDMQTSIL